MCSSYRFKVECLVLMERSNKEGTEVVWREGSSRGLYGILETRRARRRSWIWSDDCDCDCARHKREKNEIAGLSGTVQYYGTAIMTQVPPLGGRLVKEDQWNF